MSFTSNFEKVKEFNDTFDVEYNEKVNLNIFDDNKTLINHRLDLIKEEYKELKDAIESHDFIETVDALADILYVVYGAFTAIGIDADKAFDLVHKSNMTKICNTEKEAIETVEWYKENEARYDSPTYSVKVLKDGSKKYIVYNASTKKKLKSINYKPVEFNTIM